MTFRLLIFAVIACLTSTLSPGAWAQATISIAPNLVIGRRDGREGVPKNAISYADCTAVDPTTGKPADFFDVTVILSGVQGGEGMEVWVGTGTDPACGSDTGRNDLDANQCWLVHSEATAQTQIRLSVQSIIPHNSRTEPGTIADCERAPSAAGSAPLTIFFVLTDGDLQSTAAPASLPAQYDLKGPAPPEVSGIGIGDTRLYPNWKAKVPVEDAEGFRIFCEQTTAAVGEPCTAPTLVAGASPPATLAYSAQTTINATDAEVTKLTNYVRYACGIGSYDPLRNVGNLSALMCGTPQPVIGYFKAYRAAGGEAGGGWCSYGHRTKAGALSLSAFGLAALFFAGRRRQRGESR